MCVEGRFAKGSRALDVMAGWQNGQKETEKVREERQEGKGQREIEWEGGSDRERGHKGINTPSLILIYLYRVALVLSLSNVPLVSYACRSAHCAHTWYCGVKRFVSVRYLSSPYQDHRHLHRHSHIHTSSSLPLDCPNHDLKANADQTFSLVVAWWRVKKQRYTIICAS